LLAGFPSIKYFVINHGLEFFDGKLPRKFLLTQTGSKFLDFAKPANNFAREKVSTIFPALDQVMRSTANNQIY
jgi:hypothetical protein